jgi:hypothetical protein
MGGNDVEPTEDRIGHGGRRNVGKDLRDPRLCLVRMWKFAFCQK